MKQIGNLFILRININLVGSILDSPVRPHFRLYSPLTFRLRSSSGMCTSYTRIDRKSGHFPTSNLCTMRHDHILRSVSE